LHKSRPIDKVWFKPTRKRSSLVQSAKSHSFFSAFASPCILLARVCAFSLTHKCDHHIIRALHFAWAASCATPGEISSNDKDLNVIPLTEQIRQKFNVNGEMKVVKIFVVVHVEFSDGSEYNAEPAYKALKKFIEQNPTNAETRSSRKVERR
jgi:hypothetical protein